jgi:hypothetical protein
MVPKGFTPRVKDQGIERSSEAVITSHAKVLWQFFLEKVPRIRRHN